MSAEPDLKSLSKSRKGARELGAYQTIEVRPITGVIGAEIFGVDLGQPLTARQHDEVHAALMEHQVIFFRDQRRLTHERHLELGRSFGKLAIHHGVPGIDGYPEIVSIHADAKSQFVAGEDWHSDLTAEETPPMGSILYLHTVPEAGGDTMFANMYAAYEALSERMKVYIEGLNALHDADHVYRGYFPDVDKKYPRAVHPIVRTHPVTRRRLLFVNPLYTLGIVGVPKDEGDAILKYLYNHVANPNFHVRFRWRPHSVAFWDNRCTQHMAVWDYFPETRSGFRVTIAGDKPF
jgi:taurine dioxygenase